MVQILKLFYEQLMIAQVQLKDILKLVHLQTQMILYFLLLILCLKLELILLLIVLI
jgi:hypothetical protein